MKAGWQAWVVVLALGAVEAFAAALRTFEDLRSEALWLESLRRDTDIAVPRVIPARSGELVIPMRQPGIPRIWNTTLMSGVPGRLLGRYLTSRNLENRTVRVFRAEPPNLPLQDWARQNNWDMNFGRLKRDGQLTLCGPDTRLRKFRLELLFFSPVRGKSKSYSCGGDVFTPVLPVAFHHKVIP